LSTSIVSDENESDYSEEDEVFERNSIRSRKSSAKVKNKN
jgi:hypothetical protein